MSELPPPASGRPDEERDRDPSDPTRAHGPLHVEKLEGRQESGRDAQDEAEQDESPD